MPTILPMQAKLSSIYPYNMVKFHLTPTPPSLLSHPSADEEKNYHKYAQAGAPPPLAGLCVGCFMFGPSRATTILRSLLNS
jgi:hypothetical protein